MRIIKPEVEILSNINKMDILKTIEIAGRTCYKSEERITDDSSNKFVKMLIDRGHEAMIEHVNISVKFVCDRGVTHEIVRHRMASYAQESTRYCNYDKEKFGNEITVIDLATGFSYELSDENDKKKYDIWKEAMENAEKSYMQMIELGAKPEEARSVLPNSLKTEIIMTANLREWRHFFKLRIASVSHPQMREVALMLLNEFKENIPVVFDDINN